jgi:ketosteroid isomerase-like protein
MHPFRTALQARDIDGAAALLSDDVVFRSPIVFTVYRGRAAVRATLGAVARVFDDFAYVREIGAASAHDHGLVFRARIGETELVVRLGFSWRLPGG